MPVKNEFKPWIVLVGVIIFILVALACFLPRWLEWNANQNANTGLLLGLLNPGGTTGSSNLDVNAGLWQTEVEYTAKGVTPNCALTATPSNCVCPNLLDGDIDFLPSVTSLSDLTGSGIPNCGNFDVNGCTVARVGSTTNVNWATQVEADCDPTILADVLRCGARVEATGNNVFDDNSISSACNGPYNKIDDCMAGFLTAARACYIISLILIILIILVYLAMPCMGPLSLPKIALLGLVLVFLNAVAVTLGLIFAVLGFRHGCDNDWDALTGDASWGACLVLAIIALILSWLWLCWAIQVWRQAKQIRDWYIYDRTMHYGPPVAPMYKAPSPVYAAPMTPMAAPMYGDDYGVYGYPAYPQYGPTPAAPPVMAAPAYPMYGYGSEPDAGL